MSGNNSGQGVNSITSNQNNLPNFINSKMKAASIADGCCTRCGGNSVSHTNKVKADKTCIMPYCQLCDQFFHIKRPVEAGSRDMLTPSKKKLLLYHLHLEYWEKSYRMEQKG